ncbi:hypothetical protein B0H13DRAFT_1894349 [Mycena leptocephala]|nr:hypothetical protein B0H13DRAFT_1894349 [Mycena leptocephala]
MSIVRSSLASGTFRMCTNCTVVSALSTSSSFAVESTADDARVMAVLMLADTQSGDERRTVDLPEDIWTQWDRVYNTSVYWSSIVVFKSLSVERLKFGDIDIRLCLRDIRRIRGSRASIWSIARLVDDIFACISGSTDRWHSFDLSTEDPVVFRRVQLHCSGLRAPRLTTLNLAYVYMPGYSPHINAVGLYDLPFEPVPWFRDEFPTLFSLDLFCVSMHWATPGLFNNLQVVEYSDLSCSTSIDPAVFAALFSCAVNMRVLRIGPMKPFDFSPTYTLSSSSLRTVDVEFFRPAFIGRLLESIEAPSLSELVVRRLCQTCAAYTHAERRTQSPLCTRELAEIGMLMGTVAVMDIGPGTRSGETNSFCHATAMALKPKWLQASVTAYTDPPRPRPTYTNLARARQFSTDYALLLGPYTQDESRKGLYKWTMGVTVDSAVTISGTATDSFRGAFEINSNSLFNAWIELVFQHQVAVRSQ